jgi:two-component system NarL family sensor kinase
MSRQLQRSISSLDDPMGRCGRSIFFDHDRMQLLDDLLEVHDYERKRLGQELHDSAGQLLIALHLSVARLAIDGGGSRHQELIDDIQETVRRIDGEIRSLAFLHHPVELDGRDLVSAMRSLAVGFSRRTGIRVRFRSVGQCAVLDEEENRVLLRVAQESLVNVYRHAHASCVNVVLRRLGSDVELSISDDGIGMSELVGGSTPGIGLQGMRHRAEMSGGLFQVRSNDRGTRIRAKIAFVGRPARKRAS